MSNVVDLTATRNARKSSFLDELLALAADRNFPEQQLDEHTYQPAIDPVGADRIQRLFDMCGVTGLIVVNGDFQTVLNTWFILVGKVARHVETGDFISDTANTALSQLWHPAYKAYVMALREGQSARVAALAVELGISRGIPEGAADPAKGPLLSS